MSPEERPLVGIQINNESAEQAADQVRTFGIEVTCLHLPWGSVETSPFTYDWSPLDHWKGIKAALHTPPTPVWFLFPLHMNERGHIPADLRDTPLDSTEMIERWDAWVAEAAIRCEWDETEAIVTVGNEVDLFVDAHPDQREAAVTFLNAANASVRRHAPRARTGNCVTWDSINRAGGADLYRAINVDSTLATFTWYDLEGVRVRRPPTSIADTLRAMKDFAGDKPVFLQEIAMPTATACDGDEEVQAARIHELFDAATAFTQDEVLAVVWLCTNDWPRDVMADWVKNQFPGFDGDELFLGFLTSMGFVREDGTPKPAHQVWRERAAGYRAAAVAR
jgi:hypothetical protein